MQARFETCSSTQSFSEEQVALAHCNQFLLNSESFKQKIQIQDLIAGTCIYINFGSKNYGVCKAKGIRKHDSTFAIWYIDLCLLLLLPPPLMNPACSSGKKQN